MEPIKCELCKKVITEAEAKAANAKLTNTGIQLCLACVDKELKAKV